MVVTKRCLAADAPSFFGGAAGTNPLPLCPVCNFTRMLVHEREAGLCEGCAEELGTPIEIVECDGCGASTESTCECGPDDADTVNNLGLSGLVGR